MNDEDIDHLSLPQLLYALALALAPFIESIVAQAEAEGRPQSRALRNMAKTIAALRLMAALFGKQAALEEASSPLAPKARPAAYSPKARPTGRAIRALIQAPAQAAAALQALQHALLPKPPHPLRL